MVNENRVSKQIIEEELIELVKERPLLYLKTHPEHCNATAVSNAWKRISELLTKNKFVKCQAACEKMWKNIWSQFLTHKRKCKGTTGDGGGRQPFFRHAESMRFFCDKQFPERTHSNDNDSDEEDSENESSQSSSTDTNVAESLGVTNTNLEHSEVGSPLANDSVASKVVQNEPASSSSSTFSQKSRSHGGHKRQKPSQTVSEFEQELIGVFKQNGNSDEYEAFARGIGIKLRKLDGRKASEAMFRIHEALYKIEVDLL